MQSIPTFTDRHATCLFARKQAVQCRPAYHHHSRNEASMRLNRIHTPGTLAIGNEIALPPAGAYHIARVLRMREGAPLSVFDGVGHEFQAEIVRIDDESVFVRLGAAIPVTTESPLRITLIQGISRGERM